MSEGGRLVKPNVDEAGDDSTSLNFFHAKEIPKPYGPARYITLRDVVSQRKAPCINFSTSIPVEGGCLSV